MVSSHVIFLDSHKFPPYVHKILKKLADAGEYMGFNQGFTETVFKSKVLGIFLNLF